MRIVLMLLFLAAVVSFPLRARAGNIYGSLWVDGHPAQGAQIQIHCNAGHTVQTDKDGAYSVFVPENGRCNFHVDFEGSLAEERCRNALRHLEEVCDVVRVLGSYPRARTPRA